MYKQSNRLVNLCIGYDVYVLDQEAYVKIVYWELKTVMIFIRPSITRENRSYCILDTPSDFLKICIYKRS